MSQTVDEIIERFKKTRHPKLEPRTQKDYSRHYTVISSQFGHRQAKDIPLRDVQEWMNVDSGRIQRNRQLAVMSSLFGAAVEWGWLDYNVCKEVKRNDAKKRNRPVSAAEIQELKRYANKQVAIAVDLTFLTGLRQGEIIQLAWRQIDHDAKVIRRRHHRSGQENQVTITPDVDAVLSRCRELPVRKKKPGRHHHRALGDRGDAAEREYVLTTRDGDPYTSEGFRAVWQRVINRYKDAGHDPFTFQDITKSGASRQKQKPTVSGSDLQAVFADYPFFEDTVRREAVEMAPHYTVFYCLEQSIRKLIAEALTNAVGVEWWESDKIPPDIRNNARKLMDRELDMAVRQRSIKEIDYTTFGELQQIIVQNWSLFENVFTSRGAVTRVMTLLGLMRGPIAHCSRMEAGEVERFKVLVRDWFETLRKKPAQ